MRKQAVTIAKTIGRAINTPVGHMTGLMLFSAAHSWAGGTAMPWDVGLHAVTSNLTGKTALALAGGGLVGVGWNMLHHGEMNSFINKGSVAALSGGALILAPRVVNTFGIGGAIL